MLKILEINSVCGIKSTGRICSDIAEKCKKDGHTCFIAFGREQAPDKYSAISYRIGNKISVTRDAFFTRIFDNAGFNSKRATKKFVNWIKDFDPDIIHLHNLHGYYINIEVLFKYLKESNKPVVWTLHDCWSFTGHCAYFVRIGCEKWKNSCYGCPIKHSYPKSILIDNSHENFKKKKLLFSNLPNLTIVTPSEWLSEIVKKSFLANHPITVINNGIDTEFFKPTESDFKDKFGLQNKKIFLGVANGWGIRKGFFDFYKLSELLNEDEKIVLVGVTEKQKENLPNEIIGITHTNSKAELASIYAAADVFINPTYEDNYPTVNMEAQSCGTPVVTYATGGSVESVPPENIVEQGDVFGLIEKARINLKIMDKDFSNNKMASDYVSLFEAILSKK